MVSKTKVVVAGAARTAIGKFRGAFTEMPAPRLATFAVREAIRRASIEPKDVTELFFGSVIQAGLYQNCARQVVIFSGIPESVSGTTVKLTVGVRRCGKRKLRAVASRSSATFWPPRVRSSIEYAIA